MWDRFWFWDKISKQVDDAISNSLHERAHPLNRIRKLEGNISYHEIGSRKIGYLAICANYFALAPANFIPGLNVHRLPTRRFHSTRKGHHLRTSLLLNGLFLSVNKYLVLFEEYAKCAPLGYTLDLFLKYDVTNTISTLHA